MKNLSPSNYCLFQLLAACLVLAACTTARGPDVTTAESPEQAARQQMQAGAYARAAELFKAAAQQTQSNDKRNALRLDGALAALRAERLELSDQLLKAVDREQLGETDRQRHQWAATLLQALALPAQEAVEKLPPPSLETPDELAAYIWKTRAHLLFEQYEYTAGLHNLVQRETRLTSDEALQRNDELIFKRAREAIELGRGPDSSQAQQADIPTMGWLRLAAIRQQMPTQSPQREQALADWEQRFGGHPATRSILNDVFGYEPSSKPRQKLRPGQGVGAGAVVLALPLSGELAGPAGAIRAGFELVWSSHAGKQREMVVIDTTDKNAQEIVRQARAENAALIVGPLQKSKVAALARRMPQITILALNQVQDINPPPGFYRYALAPEDDARSAAAYAASRGWRHALALVPEGAWGSRVLNAFSTAFADYGGELVHSASFNTSHYDHRVSVQGVLRPYHGNAPVDFLFMAARPVHARLLRSQLRFFHATGLPVVATSDAWSGLDEPDENDDLNGVIFTTLPWLLDSDVLPSLRLQAAARTDDAALTHPRLYAMGMDAGRLTDKLLADGLSTTLSLQGATGLLTLEPDGRIQRQLAWARFRNGHARLVKPAAAAGAPASARTVSSNSLPRQQEQSGRAPANQSDYYGPVLQRDGDQGAAAQ